MRLQRRVEALESTQGDAAYRRAFLWFEGRSLAETLKALNLTDDDGPFLAVRLIGMRPGEREPRHDPVFERDKVLVGA